jgi:hypothetical protein
MNCRLLSFCLALLLAPTTLLAYPPAPAHILSGIVRDEFGEPLSAEEGIVIMERNGTEITRAPTDPLVGSGLNYQLSVPIDAGVFPGLYQASALNPGMTFNIRVLIGTTSFVPIQMVGTVHNIGTPGGRTRLDLNLGVDSDGDGIADAWERALIDSDVTGRLRSLADVTPDGDIDGDGLTNLQEQALGSYPLDSSDGLKLDIVTVANGLARVRFVCIRGRTYSIKSSTNQLSWTPVTFALTPTGATGLSHVASDTTYLDAYIAIGTAKSLSFKLYAQ